MELEVATRTRDPGVTDRAQRRDTTIVKMEVKALARANNRSIKAHSFPRFIDRLAFDKSELRG